MCKIFEEKTIISPQIKNVLELLILSQKGPCHKGLSKKATLRILFNKKGFKFQIYFLFSQRLSFFINRTFFQEIVKTCMHQVSLSIQLNIFAALLESIHSLTEATILEQTIQLIFSRLYAVGAKLLLFISQQYSRQCFYSRVRNCKLRVVTSEWLFPILCLFALFFNFDVLSTSTSSHSSYWMYTMGTSMLFGFPLRI